MSDRTLRAKLIRLAHSNPELRAQILPLLKDAGCEKLPEGGMRDNCEEKVEEGKESASKKAGGNDVIEAILPMSDMAKLYRKLDEKDEQAAELLMEVYNVLRARLKLSDGENEAMSRVRGMVTRGQNWDAGLLRNNIFKAAHSLGMKLPSFMF